jgi:predicted dienelactone hydrolase
MRETRLCFVLALTVSLAACGNDHPAATPTATPTMTVAPSLTATVAPLATLTVSPTATPTLPPTATPVPSNTATPTETVEPTPTPSVLSSSQLLAPGPDGVGVVTMTFVDDSRPTMANGTYAGSPARRLPTEIWYPIDASLGVAGTDVRDAPFVADGQRHPLVLWSHGFLDFRTGEAYLARQLASYGYVVAAPSFPLTSMNAPGGANVNDVVNQPGDVSFLIDQLLALDADPGSKFAGAIDSDRIGAAGLSLGGLTTTLTAFHPALRDARVRAAVPIAGPGCFFGPSFYQNAEVPLLMVDGSIDAIVPYQENAVFGFGKARVPKYLVTLAGGSHTGFSGAASLLFENLDNPDDVGCNALGGNPGSDDSEPSLLDLLGGADAGIIMGDCPLACVDPLPRPRAMRPSRQHQLTILSVLPFLQAELRGDAEARDFLESTLAAENEDATVQFER